MKRRSLAGRAARPSIAAHRQYITQLPGHDSGAARDLQHRNIRATQIEPSTQLRCVRLEKNRPEITVIIFRNVTGENTMVISHTETMTNPNARVPQSLLAS